MSINTKIQSLIVDLITGPGGLVYMLLLIFTIVVGILLVCNEVEKGNLVNILITNQFRKIVIFTKMFDFISSITFSNILIYFLTILLFLISKQSQGVDFVLITIHFIGFYLALLATSSIIFLFSCLFNKIIYTFLVNGGICIFFWITNILSQAIQSLSWLKYFSLNSLYNTNISALSDVKSFISGLFILLIIFVLLYVSSYYIFKRKDLLL
ncbi:ABC transporter permease subunit [Spiroplasma turonicum]|uniref:ABC transporter permease n=1 Tax=Spiroplasma turonicum TaxID=216946 RepID=A0A0K1P6Q8_9MOLU|nr:ABC transporter permease subunit [Spiroplasma turonicum]AKU79975.1 hypothetical protein STURON_00729 [Spiroplasma turonicum]